MFELVDERRIANRDGERYDSVMLGPLTMKYVFDSYDGLRTTTSLPNTSTRTDQYTTNNESFSWSYTDTTANPLYRRSERLDSLGRVSSEVMGYPHAQWASIYQLNRRPAYDSLGHARQVAWSYQTCMAWPGSNADSLSADLGWRYACSPTPMFSEVYTYDAVGNRTDNSMAIHTGNRLYTVAWATYEYDADGNLIRRTDTNTGQVRQFYWDATSHLDSVLVSGGGLAAYRVDYRYDPFGRLAWRAATNAPVGSGQRMYLYNRSDLGKEVNLVTGNTTEYEYDGTDRPIMSVERNSAGTVLVSRTYMMDGLGSVIGSVLDNSTGAALLYDSWGNIMTDTTATTRLNTLRFGFKGMLYDETLGLDTARARWYDPEVGRFLSDDPIGLSGGINQYAVAGTDPINLRDPGGLASCAGVSINADSCGDPLTVGPGGGIGDPIGSADGGFGGSIGGAGGGPGVRPLTPAEKAELGNMCLVIDCDKVRLHIPSNNAIDEIDRKLWIAYSGGAPAITPNNSIYIKTLNDDGSVDLETLAHEMTHVYQYQQGLGPWEYGWVAVATQLRRIFGHDPYSLSGVGPQTQFGSLGTEQQAQVVGLCIGRQAMCSLSPFHP
ncbi:MAG: RHS repeat-associated core domain-containing protein [Gemmatimonadota bacterium]|nr:RHS repeat-associated core domain-containing protein [Gemmatimonadota bacterium]